MACKSAGQLSGVILGATLLHRYVFTTPTCSGEACLLLYSTDLPQKQCVDSHSSVHPDSGFSASAKVNSINV